MRRWMLALVMCLAGCASHPPRCDVHLEPINAPTAHRDAPPDAQGRSR